ncbi:MAG TPA: hypothetical protein P5056_02970 [Candidatus Paceibacterota bacterium]|nr:hypothetical protein [Candidatus Paceibacterota bacterium]
MRGLPRLLLRSGPDGLFPPERFGAEVVVVRGNLVEDGEVVEDVVGVSLHQGTLLLELGPF